jgi:hypothetical protein
MSAAPVRVLIGVISQDAVPAAFSYDLARLTGYTAAMRPDIEVRLVFLQNPSRADAQHALGYEAINTNSTHLLLLEPELRFPKDALIRLLAAHPDPVVGAVYPTRSLPVQSTAKVLVHGKLEPLYVEEGASGLKPVAQLELGLTLIQVEALQRLPLPWFQEWFDPKQGSFLEPDAFFCRHAAHNDIPLLVDMGLSSEVSRLGTWVYRHDHALQMRDMNRQDPAPGSGVLDKG